MYNGNFIEKCINADALLEEIDDFIDEWHESDSDITIYEFLGMSQKEYRMWVENDDVLKYIIMAHIQQKDIDDILFEEYNTKYKMVARAKSPDEAKFMYDWLIRTGRIKE
jgi:siroheme synthase (precorrin-2 oxidase/ferrochelatase)